MEEIDMILIEEESVVKDKAYGENIDGHQKKVV